MKIGLGLSLLVNALIIKWNIVLHTRIVAFKFVNAYIYEPTNKDKFIFGVNSGYWMYALDNK